MKRILPAVFILLILLAAAVLIGPSLIDWNKYKPQIIEQAKSAAGYDVTIDGDIGLSVLPVPQLEIEGLKVAAPRGGQPNLLTMKQANVTVNLFPLISGEISIDTVRLVNPDIRLEKLADGSNSWMSDKLLADQNDPSRSAGGSTGGQGREQKIVLNKLVIEDGRVSYLDRASGKEQVAEKINLDIKAESLSGPFAVGGNLVYGGKVIELDAKTERLAGDKNEMPVDLEIGLPENNASAAFNGVVATEPLELQGKMELRADDLASVLALGGGEGSPALARKLVFSGLVTANEQQLSSQDMDITFGDAKGKGNISAVNLKDQNPIRFEADMAFEGILNLDHLAPAKDKSKEPSVEEKVARGQKLSPATSGLMPETFSLPVPVDGTLKITADGIQSGGKALKGIVLSAAKTGGDIDVAFKALDMPGKTRLEGQADIGFATASKSGEKGVTYADPTVTFTAVGASEQLPTLLRSFAPDQSSNAAFEIYKSAQFDLAGTVTPASVSLSNSSIKLDQTTVAIAGSYKPNGTGGRPDIAIDLTTDVIDIDAIQTRLDGQKKQAVQENAAAKMDVKKALEPVRSFEVPANVSFDLSAQNAIYNAQKISGVRIKGAASGTSLTLENASAQNYLGAAASLKGRVGNLADLSGIDMSFYGKTSDLKALMQSLKVDSSKLPQGISAAEASVAAKGQADALAFDAKVSALDGSLTAKGNMTGLLETPSFSNLTIGASHPNLVRAIQIMNPAFTGGPGLEKPFDFYARAVNNGKVYDLSDLKATLGATTLTGTIQIDTAAAKPAVSGSVQAGSIPLDDFLGAKDAPSGAAGGGGGGTGGNADGGKWSRATLETGWMHSINLDIALAAKSITYGGWNFLNPTTKLVLKDGNLTVDNLQSGLFGGQAGLTAKVVDPVDTRQPLSIAVQSQMENVGLEQLAYALSGSQKIKASGDVSLDFNVQTSGLSPHALVSGLQGKANLNGTNVVMKGFDLAQIGLAFVDTGKPLDRLGGIVGGATQSGETRFDTVKGAYNIMQGIVGISAMEMDGPAANVKSRGNVNLPLWTIDTTHTLTFKQAKDAGAFDVNIKGSLSNPGNTFGRGLFNDVLTRRLQQKAVEKLPDVLGDDLTGKLQGLGILPPKQQAPAQQPAIPDPGPNPAMQPETPAQPQSDAAPDVAPEQQAVEPPKTEKQKRDEETQKAIQGVLDGLMR